MTNQAAVFANRPAAVIGALALFAQIGCLMLTAAISVFPGA